MTTENVLIAGEWRTADATGTFQAENPATKEPLSPVYPVSSWADCDAVLESAAAAFSEMREMSGDRVAAFLEGFADHIEARSEDLVEMAHLETALPQSPRLADVELPRTTNQLRQAAAAARDGSWRQAIIDSAANIRSCYAPLGPVCVFGPNNFPFAFGSISGGDFAAAIAAGNPVIAKANSSHPGTTKIFAEIARESADAAGMPVGTVQLIYRTNHDVGLQMVTDSRVGATGYTGSRSAGLHLKTAADGAGKPIYLELSSNNPVIVLPGVLEERGAAVADEFVSSCLMGAGQFCTNPGMVILLKSTSAEQFISEVTKRFEAAPVGTLLSGSVRRSLSESHQVLQKAGAEVLCGTGCGDGSGHCVANTLFRVSGLTFLRDPEVMQTEAFGNSSLFVVADSIDQAVRIIDSLDGNLTGCLYTASNGDDDDVYDLLAFHLRRKVGRLINDAMPTGVAVSPAMNHGGPFPSTGHPGFTAVGIPASIHRFAMLQCYDKVRQDRLPEILRDDYGGPARRMVDGVLI